MNGIIHIRYWIVIVFSGVFLASLMANVFTFHLNQGLEADNKKLLSQKKSTVKEEFYATDEDVKKIYNDLKAAGYSEESLGTFAKFNTDLQHYVDASIIWQLLTKSGYRNYGTQQEFLLKYSKDSPKAIR